MFSKPWSSSAETVEGYFTFATLPFKLHRDCQRLLHVWQPPVWAPQRLLKAITRLPPSRSSSTETVEGYYTFATLPFKLHRDCWKLLHVCHPPIRAPQRLSKAITRLATPVQAPQRLLKASIHLATPIRAAQRMSKASRYSKTLFKLRSDRRTPVDIRKRL